MNGKIFTLRNLYQSGTEKLEKAGIREAKLDAWYLLEYKTGISRAVFLADPDREVEEASEDDVEEGEEDNDKVTAIDDDEDST